MSGEAARAACPDGVRPLAAWAPAHDVRPVTGNPAPHASSSGPARAVAMNSRDRRWLADRARNATRHPMRIGVVTAIVFLSALVVLVVLPRQQQRAADRLPELAERIDTLVLLRRDSAVHRLLDAADRTVDSLRGALAELDSAEEAAATARSARRDVRATSRDSLTILVAELTRLVDRARSAPLLASYRALAGAGAIAHDIRVRTLSDSLAAIERRREALGAAGGLDPAYVAVTAQVSAIGRVLADIAGRRLVALRYQLAAASSGVLADAPALAGLDSVRATLDSAAALRVVDSLQRVANATAGQLGVARATNARVAAAVTAARARASVGIPPLVILAATLALGLVLGTLVSLLQELISPRLSGATEAERILGVRVLGTLTATDPSANGHDHPAAGSATSDWTATRIARSLLGVGDVASRVAVIGNDPDVVATAVIGLAVAGASDARAVLVIDTDSAQTPVLRRLRRRGSIGVSDVLAGSVAWADVLVAHTGSHALALDIIPPGAPLSRAPLTASVEQAGESLARYAAGWDLILFAVTATDRPIVDVLLAHAGVRDAVTCAQVGGTELATLVAEHRSLGRLHIRHRGVVLVAGEATHGDWEVPDRPIAAGR